MSRETEITDFINDLASLFKANVGHGEGVVVGGLDAAVTMRVDARTIRNYSAGLTTGSMTIEAFARFGREYRRDFPAMTDQAVDLLCRVFGGHFVRDGVEDATFLDANGDGRADHRDIPAHASAVIKTMADEAVEGDGTQTTERKQTSRDRCSRARRHARAMERLTR